MRPAFFPPVGFEDHQLVDSGEGEKLERFGELTLVRPDPQALWRRRFGGAGSPWECADLVFVPRPERGGRGGLWEPGPGARRRVDPDDLEWTVGFGDGRFLLRPTSFKHVGLFPEQATNWLWAASRADAFPGTPRLLNLFGYTGVASTLALLSGYAVTHVDASRTSLAWARENLVASGLPEDAMKIVLDDALGFARREARRGVRYEGILLDPPHQGRGPRGERWRFERGARELMEACGSLLAERAFLVLSTYATGHTALALENLVADLGEGRTEVGELVLAESEDTQRPRLLPCGFTARFSRGLDG